MSRTSLIVYACPVGPLATQIEAYLQQSQQNYGPNSAHAYMPHCTLTGFFCDKESAIPHYIHVLNHILSNDLSDIPSPSITIQQMAFQPNWHGLILGAEWLKQLIVSFAQQADSATCTEPLRLKDWLHLSLAYDFSPADAPALQQMATELIDITAPVSWELRFYQRANNCEWTCHKSWPLG